MDRPIVFTQEQGRSVDFLFAQRATMIGLAKLSQAAFGGNTVVRGLPVTPNSPAALNVLVGIGEIYSMTAVDATTWGSLPADTTDIVLKQGLNMAAQTISTPAPTTSGFSIAYLIEAQYQDQDTTTAVLPFYNSSNPQIPLNGQNGLGAPLPTERQGVCVIQAKAGIAATTGTQVTPTVDSGWTALAVVTVANGATTVTSGNISVPAGVPQVTSLLQMMQTGSPVYAVDTSTTVNQISIALTPAITAYTDGQEITFKAANNNTGPCTINAGPGSINLVGAAGALQGAEIVAGSQYTAIYSASLGELVLNSQTGGAEQINPGTKSQHAVQLGQLVGVVGSVRNLLSSVAAASASKVVTADNVIVTTALGGLIYGLSGLSLTGNLATQMDTGSAPASGYVAEYLIYNPNAAISGTNPRLLYTNAATLQPNVYGGSHMPSGYTASALIGVWPTNASGQFPIAFQLDREVFVASVPSGTFTTALTNAAVTLAVPLNAKTVSLATQQTTTGASTSYQFAAAAASPVNGGLASMTQSISVSTASLTTLISNGRVALLTPQTTYLTWVETGGTFPQLLIAISSYTF